MPDHSMFTTIPEAVLYEPPASDPDRRPLPAGEEAEDHARKAEQVPLGAEPATTSC